jgi:REP element-mobilizing transposase RayT
VAPGIEQGKTMPQSLAKVIVHIVYSTKHRKPWLHDPSVRSELCAYAATVLKQDVDSPAILINAVEDHIHILCLLSRKFAIMEVVKKSKTETSKWIKKQAAMLKDFQWQAGYGIFSVSQSNVEQVKRYIGNQDEHHKRMSFQDEFREICRRHGIEIDERYVWD